MSNREPFQPSGRHPEVLALLLIGLFLVSFSEARHSAPFRMRPAVYSPHHGSRLSTAVASVCRALVHRRR